MLEYWKRQPMPAEDFVIERCGSEVKNVIAGVRNNPSGGARREDIYLKAAKAMILH